MMQLSNENLITAIAIGLILLGTSAKQLGNGNTQFFCFSSMSTSQIMAIYCTLKIKDPETKARSPPIFILDPRRKAETRDFFMTNSKNMIFRRYRHETA